MKFIEKLKEQAKQERKRIVLPEAVDERILEASEILIKEQLVEVILLGSQEEIFHKRPSLKGVTAINPMQSELTEKFAKDLYELRKEKGLTLEEAHRLLTEDFMYFACMLVKEGMADGVVSGAIHSTANTLRPALQIIKTKPNAKFVSSFFLMEIPNCEYTSDGLYLFSDCALVQNPTSEELADIAISSARSFEALTGKVPYVAMLSHSTKGSAHHADVDKVVKATKLAQEMAPDIQIDGELQLDAAIVSSVGQTKAPDSKVAGRANVLIFPDLDAGNIGYKLVQRFAHADAYGPVTQGMYAPVNDLSRGCTVDDIVGTVVITAVLALQMERER